MGTTDVDINTAIPKVVREQAEKADRIHREQFPDQYPQAEAPPAELEKPPETPPEKPPETPPEKPPEKPPEPTPAEPPKEDPNSETWQARFQTLQGKYNAEVPRLHTALAASNNQIRELQARIKTFETSAPAPAKPKEGEVNLDDVDDADIKSFKEEYPDIYKAMSKMVTKTKPKEPEKPSQVEPQKPAGTDYNPRESYYFFLDRNIPDWKAVNKDPYFVAFLNQPDPRDPSFTRMQTIQLADAATDASTVSEIFKDFKATSSAANKATPVGPGSEPPKPKVDISPPKAPRQGTPPPPSKPTVTQADLKKFYGEARKGTYGPIDGEKYLKEEMRLMKALGLAK
jgi:hypothetical protein